MKEKAYYENVNVKNEVKLIRYVNKITISRRYEAIWQNV